MPEKEKVDSALQYHSDSKQKTKEEDMADSNQGVDLSRRLGIVRLSHRARLPTRSSSGAAGLDRYPTETALVAPQQTKLIHTDIAVQLPTGCYATICNKSKISVTGLNIVMGILDNDYTGPLIVQVYNRNSRKAIIVSQEMPIAQLVVQPYISPILDEQDAIPPTTRGWNAFGTTDFKNRGNYRMSHEKPATHEKLC
jgi:dUTP pyrophosphatase